MLSWINYSWLAVLYVSHSGQILNVFEELTRAFEELTRAIALETILLVYYLYKYKYKYTRLIYILYIQI